VKVLLSWLKEFVDVNASGEEVGARMSLRGFALEGIERVAHTRADGSTKADDEILDFDVTSNRPDCMNVLGLAREIAAAYGHSLNRRPELTPVQLSELDSSEHGHHDIAITIENDELCRVYAGAVADVTIGPSPSWMQERLKASGIRPISNIVDITNYVLLELGQPMHAFDITKLAGQQIRVRTARGGERLKTLDGQDRELTPEMLIIADAEKPVAIAGVMGGADSEVNDKTTTIVFESAHFAPLSVRRTSRTLGMKTEASMRFERGADWMLPPIALIRALTLLEEIGAGTQRGIVIAGRPEQLSRRVLQLRRDRIQALLGTHVPDQDVFRILGSLGFTTEPMPDGWNVTVPSRRIDVHREVDLIEEVARHYGFDRIPSHFPPLAAAPAALDPRITQARRLRAVMNGAGFSEAVTFGFMSQFHAAPFVQRGDDWVKITNPLSENYAVLRPSIVPGLLTAIAHNRNRQQRDIRLFEIGNRFTRDTGERRTVACAWTGTASSAHWSGSARDVDFFDMKGLVDRIGEALQRPVVAVAGDEHVQWLAPGRAAIATDGNHALLGYFGQIPAALSAEYGLPERDPVYVAEIDLDTVANLASPQRLEVQPLPRFPLVTRDISILVANTLPAATVRETIRTAAPDSLIAVSEFDRYQGKGVPEAQVSLSIRLTFRSPDRTLTDAEVQSAMDAILTALKDKHAAVQR
jgi:phenylalanyl-tRNA synthetase beta chain